MIMDESYDNNDEDPKKTNKYNGVIIVSKKCICFNGKKLVKWECKEDKMFKGKYVYSKG